MTIHTYAFVSGGVKASGSAISVHPVKRTYTFLSGGVKVSGVSTLSFVYNLNVFGGVKVSGAAVSAHRTSVRQYVSSGGIRASGKSFTHGIPVIPPGTSNMTSIPNTTCSIGAFSFVYEQAHTLNWSISSNDSSGHSKITITGSGFDPPPFNEDSFTGPIAITLQKQSFPSYSGTVVVKQVSIDLAANEAEWQWTIEAEESTSTTCTIGAFSIGYDEARSLTWSISKQEDSDYDSISISGSGVEPPPFNENSFTAPVSITLQKQNFPSYTGTVLIKQVSITTTADTASWSWTIEAEEQPAVANFTCTIGSYSITLDHVKDLDWSTSNSEGSSQTTVNINGSGGKNPPPFTEDSFTTSISVTLIKGSLTYTNTVRVKDVSINTNAINGTWSWSVSAEEVTATTCTIDGNSIDFPDVNDLNWTISSSDSTGHASLSVSGSGLEPPPFDEDSFTGPITISLQKPNAPAYSGTVLVNQVSVTTNALEGSFSWSLSATETTATTCTIGSYSVAFPEADDLTWTVASSDTSGHASISISGAGLEPPPFDETSFTGPISITLQKPSFPAYTGTVIVTQVSVETNAAEKSWSWSIQAVESTATTCTIGSYSIGYEEAHTLSWSISSSESTGLASISINGGGLEPPPFNESSFSGPISLVLQKESFPSYTGSVIVSSVSINTAADSASFSWSLTATEAPTKVCTIGGYTITQSAAYELNWSVAANFPSVRPTISISGTGLTHPPFYEDSFPTVVAVTLSSQGTTSYSGTVLIKTVNIQTDTKNATWSWSLDGEEVPTSVCTIAGSTLSYEQAYDLSWDISNIEAKYVMRAGDGTAIVRTAWTGKHAVSISGTGREPPPFSSDSFPGLFDISLQKGSSSYSGSVIATSVSVTTNATDESWSWSLECEEV
jgi:hypothetical protein